MSSSDSSGSFFGSPEADDGRCHTNMGVVSSSQNSVPIAPRDERKRERSKPRDRADRAAARKREQSTRETPSPTQAVQRADPLQSNQEWNARLLPLRKKGSWFLCLLCNKGTDMPQVWRQKSRFLQIRLGSESCDQISASPNRPKRAKSRDRPQEVYLIVPTLWLNSVKLKGVSSRFYNKTYKDKWYINIIIVYTTQFIFC